MSMENNPVKRFYQNGKKGWRPAINAMCASCVGCSAALQGKGFKDYLEAGFRDEIRSCTVFSCPIRHLRPYQVKQGAGDDVNLQPKLLMCTPLSR